MSKMAEVIAEAVPEQDRNLVTLHTMLLMNTGGGRPSDCARQAVAEYEQLGLDAFTHAHWQRHRAALAVCPCEACQRDLARMEESTR